LKQHIQLQLAPGIGGDLTAQDTKSMLMNALSLLYESLIFLSSLLVKKDKNIWVFGAIRGQKYTDNARYLFEYVNKHTDTQAIWISKNPDVISEVRSKGFKAYYEYSFDALHYARRAKIAVITHRGSREKSDLPFYAFTKDTKIIQLWHGIPLKKIAYDDTIFSFKHDETSVKWRVKSRLKRLSFPFLNYVNNPSLILALSEETKSIFAQAFRTETENVTITGYPRNDCLVEMPVNPINGGLKKIIYMPTFRGSVNSSFDLFAQFGFDVEKLDHFLAQEKMVLHIKLHPFNLPSDDLLRKLREAANIVFLEHDAIYEILSDYDVLITDYSSIYFDYLLLDRPIIFTPFDQDTYLKNERSFYFNYDETTPGPKAYNWDEVMQELAHFNLEVERYSAERTAIRNRFHTFQDRNSTQRVYKAIGEIASEK
jgi:CDP-glycerol glycerophosphotransferase